MKEKTRSEFHREYGGRIYNEDYEGEITLVEMAKRIALDKRFDRYLIKRLEEKNSGGADFDKQE